MKIDNFMLYFREWKRIKNNYLSLGLIEKIIIFIRLQTTPIPKILEMIPLRGNLLDLGCGFGVFSYYLAFKYPSLRITGIDPSLDRITLAKNVKIQPKNLNFNHQAISQIIGDKFDATIIIDVEYLMSKEEIDKMLKECYEKTNDIGLVIIKTMNKDRALRHFMTLTISKFIDKSLQISGSLMGGKSDTKVFGLRKRKPFYYHPFEFRQMLEEAGWQSIEIFDLPMTFFFYPNIIYIGRKLSSFLNQ